MTAEEKIFFKTKLKQYCISIIEQRVANARLAMQQAQAAANEEEKSSAGDKYETSRAMSHLEKDMHAKQLEANLVECSTANAIDCNRIYDKLQTGSIIICEEVSFFILAGLGKISFEGANIYLLSPNAPLSKLLFNKNAGDSIPFNKKLILIKDFY